MRYADTVKSNSSAEGCGHQGVNMVVNQKENEKTM
jgi:hypothetical protein